jgi:hypothetical protein
MMNAYKYQLNGKDISLGKSVIRYSKPERIDFSMFEMALRATRESTGPIC